MSEIQHPLVLSSKNLFFTSDLHFGHKNILRYTKCHLRYGETLETLVPENSKHWRNVTDRMNEDIIAQWNSVVSAESTVILMGDNGFISKTRLSELLSRLNGTIHFVVGNHDEHIPDRFASVSYYLELIADGQQIVCSHYPFYRWNQISRGSWHLYGHEHGNLRNDSVLEDLRSMDIGIHCHPEFRPFSMAEVREVMKTKKDFKYQD